MATDAPRPPPTDEEDTNRRDGHTTQNQMDNTTAAEHNQGNIRHRLNGVPLQASVSNDSVEQAQVSLQVYPYRDFNLIQDFASRIGLKIHQWHRLQDELQSQWSKQVYKGELC
jgi:hypothetical protein